MKKLISMFALALAVTAVLGSFSPEAKAAPQNDNNQDNENNQGRFQGFVPGSIVISGTVYEGRADSITIGQVMPPGCLNNGPITNPTPATYVADVLKADQPPATTSVNPITCGYASENGEYPNLKDSHNVWNNDATDGSFGISSPIVLWNVSTNGHFLGALWVPSHEIVTSFSSKSELALNRSADGRSLTFMGYRGGPGCFPLALSADNFLTQDINAGPGPISPTGANLLDVSASNTPGLCDPTNTAVSSFADATGPTAYYRSVAEVDSWGNIRYTNNDAYSGDNSRAVIKADNSLYYSVGNDNSGNLSKKQVGITQLGFNLSHSTGAELITPGQTPLVPPANNMISFFISVAGDKPGKDTNFRGLRIFNDTLFVSKGSGGNGINTVYQLGKPGVLPTTANAPVGGLVNEPWTILPGFPNTAASTNNPGGDYPFGIWFANSTTLYVCDEGDLAYTPNQVINGQVNVADSGTLTSAGLQKWVLTDVNGAETWVLKYVIQNGLNLGLPYSVKDYPASIEPAIGGCRNIIGVVNHDGTATIYAITSTISQNGDNGADPNTVVKVTDVVNATTLPGTDVFQTIVGPHARVAYRGVTLAPTDDDDDH